MSFAQQTVASSENRVSVENVADVLSGDGVVAVEHAADVVPEDSVVTAGKKPSFLKRIVNGVVSFVNEFSTYDSLYIEPQHYKFQVMGQMTSRFEEYTVTSETGHEIKLAPETSTTFGPYAGYSLIFLGYTLQLNNLYIGKNMKTFNLSLYTSLVGADFYYNKNSDFKVKYFDVDGKGTYDTSDFINNDFYILDVKFWGFNTYYIFNHRKHSYPATYNQSTCQKRSAGSPLVGFGFGSYDLRMNWAYLYDNVAQKYPDYSPQFSDDEQMQYIQYDCYSLYGGYSYNWVFAPNWLVGASASLAVSYNKSSGDIFRWDKFYYDFKFTNLSLDGIGRIGLVWNNTRFFAGASATVHSYNYKRDQFSLNNIFGSYNVYFGLNFGKKKAYRKPGKFFEF